MPSNSHELIVGRVALPPERLTMTRHSHHHDPEERIFVDMLYEVRQQIISARSNLDVADSQTERLEMLVAAGHMTHAEAERLLREIQTTLKAR